eukprot:440385-Pelagomonas_calceolata.AAC.1
MHTPSCSVPTSAGSILEEGRGQQAPCVAAAGALGLVGKGVEERGQRAGSSGSVKHCTQSDMASSSLQLPLHAFFQKAQKKHSYCKLTAPLWEPKCQKWVVQIHGPP